MGDKPLSIVISALVDNNKILLIERVKGDYVGLLGLPGGKVEKNEHLSQAAVREIKEESGIDSEFLSHLGVVSEHLIENNKILQHFLLHVCELIPKSKEITHGNEGQLKWFDLDTLPEMKDKIIPSDFYMIEEFLEVKKKTYFDCIVEKVGDEYVLKKFD